MQLITDNNIQFIFLLAILLIVGVFTAKFSNRLGVPSLVLFIVVGMGLNQFFYYDDASLTQLIGLFALIVILFEGGLQTKWEHVRPVLIPSLSLATIGVILTSVVIGMFATWVLGLTWLEGMLFGAIVGSTDAAAVFAVLGNKNIKRRLTSTLEAESGTNDPMAMFLTITLIQLLEISGQSIYSVIGNFFLQMTLGLIVGIIMGKLAIWIINKINLDSFGLYPVLSLGLAIFAFGSASLLQGSGLLAVFVMAVLMGNADLPYRHSIFRFNEGFAWMMQILMFILLGLLVFPSGLMEIVWQGLVLSLLLMFVARPVGVFISTAWMKFSFKERIFISWAGLRGAVPIVLATYPLIAGLENGMLFFDVVFFIVLTSALIQGVTISPLAKKLGLVGDEAPQVAYTLELVSLGKTNTEIMEIKIDEGASAGGKKIHQLELPDEILISAVIRGDQLITPHGNTILHEGDTLYVLLPKDKRDDVKKCFSS